MAELELSFSLRKGWRADRVRVRLRKIRVPLRRHIGLTRQLQHLADPTTMTLTRFAGGKGNTQ